MFNKARLKLTAWYLLIIMTVSLSFSAVVYRIVNNELERFGRMQRFRIEHDLPGDNLRFRLYPPPSIAADPDLLQESRNRLIVTLAIVNGTVFFIAGALGYFLAGRTLNPIGQMLDEQNRFISDASHELRTPLTSLKSSLEVNLRDKNMTLKEARVLIKESIDEVNKLQRLSNNLLELARYQSSSNQSHFSVIDLSHVVKQAVSKVSNLARNRHIKIINQVSSLTVYADEASLVELFVILLDNAIKYSAPASDILITSHSSDSFASIRVADHGIGISSSDLPHIFDRFYRADLARSKSDMGGYGLGLSIAKNIITAHRGHIEVESELQKGSIFTVSLPLKK